MRFKALATDYDGTLASGGCVAETTVEALRRLRASGRKLFLATGRELDDLAGIFPELALFDRVVAENGGVLFDPKSGERRLLASPPPPEFVDAMRQRGVEHLSVSSTLVATSRPAEIAALEAIRDLGLDLHVVFNGDAVMILAPGVSKASGLIAALDDCALSPHNVVAVGDAENDYPFIDLCECTAAVANALPMLRSRADIVTRGAAGEGVAELIGMLLEDDLARFDTQLQRHWVRVGRASDGGEPARLSPYGTVALVAGPSGAGKSTATSALLERIADGGYQLCLFDPEGDHEGFADAITLGGADHAPSPDQVLQLLHRPRQNVIVNLMRVPLADRPQFCARLLPRLQELRVNSSRPHWLVFEEAHHLFPAHFDLAATALPQLLDTAIAATVHPAQLAPAFLRQVNTVLAIGEAPGAILGEFLTSCGEPVPQGLPAALERGQALCWRRGASKPPAVVIVEPGRMARRRHVRKYAEGMLIPERSFYFRGPEGKLRLRAHNLVLFVELAAGVDDDTWLFHLRNGDYARWFEAEIGDRDLADEARRVASEELSAEDSRARIREAIEKRYTAPENPCLPTIASAAR